ncbi:AEC family transporter [Acuticoccus sp. M5D2P5]|uniref:AEC family transporter n=1 Tax=Acuticoccus kalidii TaxID=2910977 RepID=UPI001F32EA97|nr:AEC family transporter [Acuticoccus kalidii]MCF3935711.1 AEC family transporter [Acuticoccus kalidii]
MIHAALLALVPIALLIGLGYLLRRRGFVADGFWPAAERLSYFVLLPCLFFHGLATADLGAVPVPQLAGTLVLSLVTVSLMLVVAERYVRIDGAAFTSVFQGGVRFNNYVGITAALALFGAPAIGIAAVANAAIVPTVNILVVLVFARYGAARPTVRGVARGIVTNPLILGCAAGIMVRLLGVDLPDAIAASVRALGQAALPIGLLCVGAALEWSVIGRALRPTLAASVVKFAVMPSVTILACLLFGLDGRAAVVAVMFQSLPTASSSYVMARQLGGDAPLMAGIVAFQTVLALVTLPVVLVLTEALFGA